VSATINHKQSELAQLQSLCGLLLAVFTGSILRSKKILFICIFCVSYNQITSKANLHSCKVYVVCCLQFLRGASSDQKKYSTARAKQQQTFYRTHSSYYPESFIKLIFYEYVVEGQGLAIF
jgi:hypothetical protein